MSVQVKQSAERAPHRDGQKTKPEHLVDEVEVIVKALAAAAANEGVARPLVMPWPVRGAWLHGREDVHEPRAAASRCEDLLIRSSLRKLLMRWIYSISTPCSAASNSA